MQIIGQTSTQKNHHHFIDLYKKKAHQMAHHIKAKHISTFSNSLYQIRNQVLCIENAKELPYLRTKGKESLQIMGLWSTIRNNHNFIDLNKKRQSK